MSSEAVAKTSTNKDFSVLDNLRRRENMQGTYTFVLGKSTGAPEETLGGKGASIQKLKKLGFPVAKGIVLTTEAFERFLKESELEEKINAVLKHKPTEKEAKDLIDLVRSAKLPDDISAEIAKRLEELGISDSALIVRSSANVEDSSKNSFAGQFDTVIDVKPDEVAQAVLDVYASLFNLRALRYMESRDLSSSGVKMAVVVQEFVDTDFAGVAFTVNPVTGRSDRMIVEYVQGLGEGLVSGAVEPTSIELNKKDLAKISERKPPKTNEVNYEIVEKVARSALKIENEYGASMDVEWGVKDGRLIIFQARRVTAAGGEAELTKFDTKGYATLNGIPASVGVGGGPVRIVRDKADLKALEKGDVLVCMITFENYMPDMLKAAAIVTQRGGLTSHAAIIGREHKIPCVVGVTSALTLLKDGENVIVDATEGIVYHRGRSQKKKMPEEAMDIILERAVPHRATLEKGRAVALKRSTVSQHVEEPAKHVLLEELDDALIIHNPPSIKIDPKLVKKLERERGKPVFIFGGDKYDTYTEVVYAMGSNRKFRELHGEMIRAMTTGAGVEAFSKKCIDEDLSNMDAAGRVLKGKELTAKEACAALQHINDASIYFAFVNTLLTTGYGVNYVRKQFNAIKDEIRMGFPEFIIAIDERKEDIRKIRGKLSKKSLEILDNAIEVYRALAKWKFKSDDLDDWDRRGELWKAAAKEFKRTTGHDVKEFLDEQYGSGVKLEKFFRKLGYNG